MGTSKLQTSLLLYFPFLLLTCQHQASLPWELPASSDASHLFPLEAIARSFGFAPAAPRSIFFLVAVVARLLPHLLEAPSPWGAAEPSAR